MEETLTIKQVAKYLNLKERTVRNHIYDWGFFKMTGSRVWRIHKSDLDLLKKRSDNADRLALSVEEVQLCRSTKETKMARGGLISQPQAVKELDAQLARL
ncbi:helix-turn-helix domain-containing protein [Pasteurella caecimuris]|uniref:helix-turn-helix domain-containing protein n=1 Tax=Rodentibacter caecimuris TaxID=1796644 RepID=UPI002150513D|nr:helix-turn-helix domain-containing protein [Pasteurella caecimuris]MCR1837601.1 helix-turn-helix domain-containing protein [Pasteurella caecimuris]MCU0107987.1 helix-turn-helix domain-containing protein [Pasteurella caecimuris]